MKKSIIFFTLVLIILNSGCNAVNQPDSTSTAGSTVISTPQSTKGLSDLPSTIKTTSPSKKNIIPTAFETLTIVSTSVTDLSNDQKEIVARTTKNLSDRIKTPVDQIKLVSIDSVNWPDSSLGCLIPGTVVNEIEIPGYIIKLTANSQIFTYHTDSNIQIVICSDDKPFEIYHPP